MCFENQEIGWKSLMPPWQQDMQQWITDYIAKQGMRPATQYPGPMYAQPPEQAYNALDMINRMAGYGHARPQQQQYGRMADYPGVQKRIQSQWDIARKHRPDWKDYKDKEDWEDRKDEDEERKRREGNGAGEAPFYDPYAPMYRTWQKPWYLS